MIKKFAAWIFCALLLASAAGCSRLDQPESAPESSQTSLSVSIPEETSSAAPDESEQSASSESNSSEAEAPWRYGAENPREYDLAAALADFPRHLSLESLLSSLPDSSRVRDEQGDFVRLVQSGGWSFLGTEGVLCAKYAEDPEGDGILLERLDYWTINYDLDTYVKMLEGINALNLPGVENYEQRPLALTDIYLADEGGYIPGEEYTEPYLPPNSNTYGATLLADGAGGKAYAIECVFWSGDKAAEFCPEILTEGAPEILSGIQIRLSYSTDVGV